MTTEVALRLNCENTTCSEFDTLDETSLYAAQLTTISTSCLTALVYLLHAP
jgi:hypothetical protein